ncbi:MAG TPA: SPOR domain-containing protein [Acidiphilium sp.]
MNEPDIDIPPYASARLRGRSPDRATWRMMGVAGGIGLGVIVLALVWSGVHTGLGPPPVVKPPAGPMRTAPVNPGGLQVPGAHEQIMSGTVASGPPQLAPLPSAPDFSKLDQAANKLKQEEAARAHPVSPPAAVATGVPSPSPSPAAPAATPVESGAQTASASLPLPPPSPAASEIAPPAPPVPTPEQASTALQSAQAPTQVAGTGPYAVQLAALTSMAKANEAWQTLVARVPGILGKEKPVVVPGVVRGQTFYRLRLGGFASAGAATAFCDRLKSRGVTCYIPKR